jgi:hypothetical protein
MTDDPAVVLASDSGSAEAGAGGIGPSVLRPQAVPPAPDRPHRLHGGIAVVPGWPHHLGALALVAPS